MLYFSPYTVTDWFCGTSPFILSLNGKSEQTFRPGLCLSDSRMTAVHILTVGIMGVARIFQRGGHTDSYRGYSSDCHLNIVSCLLTRRLTKGGGHGHPRTPPPPWLRLWLGSPS